MSILGLNRPSPPSQSATISRIHALKFRIDSCGVLPAEIRIFVSQRTTIKLSMVCKTRSLEYGVI